MAPGVSEPPGEGGGGREELGEPDKGEREIAPGLRKAAVEEAEEVDGQDAGGGRE